VVAVVTAVVCVAASRSLPRRTFASTNFNYYNDRAAIGMSSGRHFIFDAALF
jgi:hypothetical protein